MKQTIDAIGTALKLAKALKPETTLTQATVCHLTEAQQHLTDQFKQDELEKKQPKPVSLNVIEQATDGTLIYWCPGCREHHGIWLKANPNPATGCAWSWNGSKTAPTCSPSILVKPITSDGKVIQPLCHSFIKDGKIEFLSDCQHKLAGQTITMLPEMEDDLESANRDSHHAPPAE